MYVLLKSLIKDLILIIGFLAFNLRGYYTTDQFCDCFSQKLQHISDK